MPLPNSKSIKPSPTRSHLFLPHEVLVTGLLYIRPLTAETITLLMGRSLTSNGQIHKDFIAVGVQLKPTHSRPYIISPRSEGDAFSAAGLVPFHPNRVIFKLDVQIQDPNRLR